MASVFWTSLHRIKRYHSYSLFFIWGYLPLAFKFYQLRIYAMIAHTISANIAETIP